MLVRQDPEDEPVARVIDAAVADLGRLGTEVVEVDIDGLAELLDSYVVLSHEFKFDLEAYLAATPDAPVSSLAQVLAEGLYHPAVGERLTQSNAVETLDTEVYREALGRRETIRRRVVEMLGRPFAEVRLVALVYAFEQGTGHRRPPPATPPLEAPDAERDF